MERADQGEFAEIIGVPVIERGKGNWWIRTKDCDPIRLWNGLSNILPHFASDNLGIQRTSCYTVLDMEEEAIITAVRPGTQRSLGEVLDINFLQVSFRVLRRSRYRDHGYKVTLKSPAWLSQLEPSAPLNGYLMEHGEFSAELTKDERINEDLKVTVEVTDV